MPQSESLYQNAPRKVTQHRSHKYRRSWCNLPPPYATGLCLDSSVSPEPPKQAQRRGTTGSAATIYRVLSCYSWHMYLVRRYARSEWFDSYGPGDGVGVAILDRCALGDSVQVHEGALASRIRSYGGRRMDTLNWESAMIEGPVPCSILGLRAGLRCCCPAILHCHYWSPQMSYRPSIQTTLLCLRIRYSRLSASLFWPCHK